MYVLVNQSTAVKKCVNIAYIYIYRYISPQHVEYDYERVYLPLYKVAETPFHI